MRRRLGDSAVVGARAPPTSPALLQLLHSPTEFPRLAPSSTASSSPPEAARYKLRPRLIKRARKMSRAQWNDEETRLLLTLCLQEKDKLNFSYLGLTNTGWSNVYTYFPHYDKKQCNNKLYALKSTYVKWKASQKATGLGREPRTGDIAAEPEYWDTQYGSQPQGEDPSSPVPTRGKAPKFLALLEALYGDRNRNTGIFMSAGGHRDAIPPPVFPPGLSTNNSRSKRPSREHGATSPVKKKSCDMGEYMARISESIAARSSSRDRERTREQAEVDEAMKLLRDDGVPGCSTMFFVALELFKNSVYRREFKNLLNAQERHAWLAWHVNGNPK